jgi:tetratricopeptide (TPR) repeat protein
MNRQPQAPTRAPDRPRRTGGILLALFVSLLPHAAGAHGELLLRIAELTRRIQTASNDLAVLYLQRGELYRQDQNWSAAEADLARAAQLDPTLPVDLCRAKLLADTGQLEAARAQFDALLSRAPQNAEAWLGRAEVHLRQKRISEALADFRRALELSAHPLPAQALTLARALRDAGRADEALNLLDASLRNTGAPLELHAEALNLELECKNFDAALQRLEVILRRAHRKEEWLAKRGEILLQAGRPAEARQAFEAALAAIRTLPQRIQQNPPMLKLRADIHAALARLNGTSLAASATP